MGTILPKEPGKIPRAKTVKYMGEEPTLKKGIYRHYKGGIYEVIELACNSETLEWYVVYVSKERSDQDLPSVWVRPYEMFIETVEVDGSKMQRFEKIDDEQLEFSS